MTSSQRVAAPTAAVVEPVTHAVAAPTRTIERIVIVNRGEPAMRLIHAVRELNEDTGLRLRTIALYTEADRHALFVREADEAVLIGSAMVTDGVAGRHNAYVDLERLKAGLLAARADAAWVGWGFVAEKPEFAELCARLGVAFIGPEPAAMRLLGDKIAAKRLAEDAGVPVGAWSGGPLTSIEAAQVQGERLGYPLMIKAAAGGGGRGMRRVQSAAELPEAFKQAQSEAAGAFGDDTVFMERLLPVGRHVEVQVVSDGAGTSWAVGIRDCSVQRRHQKVIEESASTVVDDMGARRLCEAAVRLANRAGYRGVGTVEFLVDPVTRDAVFMEVNTRLQVEHPVTEMATGLDLVKLQIHLARGGTLEGEPPAPRGHAIEVRLNAEDPDNNFAPAPGVVDLLRLPTGPGIRVDTGISEGDAVAPEFDSMIAKIIAWGRDRKEALGRLRRALGETAVVLRGGTTNRAFLLDLLSRPEVRDGTADVGWLDRATVGESRGRPLAHVALLVAAAELDELATEVERAQFYAAAARGRPRVLDKTGRIIELRLDGQQYSLHAGRRGPHEWSIGFDGRMTNLEIERIERYERRVRMSGASYRAVCVQQGAGFIIEVDGVPYRVGSDEGGVIHSPSPAVVASLRVAPGDSVEEGDTLAVLEAMKMEMPLRAPYAGTISKVFVTENVQVDTGAPLLQLDIRGERAAPTTATADRAMLDAPPLLEDDATARCIRALDPLRRLVLGYEVDAATEHAALAAYGSATALANVDDPDLLRAENEILSAFADVLSLSRRVPSGGAEEDKSAHAAQEHLNTYLRSLNADTLPHSFVAALRNALRHYGVDDLERTPPLEDALFKLVRAHHRVEDQVPIVMALLDGRLERPLSAGEDDDEYRSLLDRLVSATRRRLPAVADLAREVRHRRFDQPLMERARKAVYDDVEASLARLARVADSVESPERAAIIKTLVDCPQPLHNLFMSRFANPSPALRAAMLEVMLRRYYRIHQLHAVRVVQLGSQLVATAETTQRGKPVRVLTAYAAVGELADVLAEMRPLIDEPGAGRTVIDAYVWDETAHDVERVVLNGRRAVNAADLPASVYRVVLAVTGPGRALGMAGGEHVTYRRTGTRFTEDRVYRGLHPAMAERLHVGRLRNFQIERLPSVEDVYLFHGVARTNPRDERLFAFAEVRDLTPVLDEHGRVVGLPHLERMLLEALAGIRTWQSHRSPGQRTEWNRVLLYVWPPIELDAREIHTVVRRLAPETEGLGLEQVVVEAHFREPNGKLKPANLYLSNPLGRGIVVTRFDAPRRQPLEPLDAYRQKVVSMRRRGLPYPYEVVQILAPATGAADSDLPSGEFVEYDLDDHQELVRVDRRYGGNTANLVVGVMTNRTATYPEGMTRVILLGDASRSMGTLAEPECRRINAAIDLAERMRVPLEWFTLSSGAKIAMNSGTENMDWIGRVLRRIVEFTQAGGEINLVVNGINVGAQPYWNAEATMLMHTRGILIMTPDGAMVLTGKQALDYSGSVSAEDNFGIGGYERIMGPNGQAQYWAPDLVSACQLLVRHYEHTYIAPGERFPRRAATDDSFDRDVSSSPHPRVQGSDFTHVGDVFSDERNPGRKKPFDIRAVMRAVADSDHAPLERWTAMRHAEIAVVWDVHLGGYPVCLLGLESQPLPRPGFVPADGPDYWTPGTLFPQSSKKVARAINSASGNRPVVALANLSGFDGSPESMRRLQLEFGAEIGRAVVNFRGPMVFCVISRYHGGAFVVFSATLNERMEVAAVEGSFASVIGGAPAAAVVFARDVDARTKADPRVVELQTRAIADADAAQRTHLRARLTRLLDEVRSEKLGEVAAEFDAIHTVQRAQRVGSLHRIVAPASLRPYLIDAVERGIARELGNGA